MQQRIKPRHIVSILAVGGVAIAAVTSNQPLFSSLSLDNFVLVAEDKVHLANDVQISSGDIAVNQEINVSSNNIVNGSLFSDQIKIAENNQINGNATFNSIKIASGSEVLGQQTSTISLPIVDLPEILDFTPGTQNLIIQEDQTITPGSYNKIEVKPDVTLTLTPGIYYLNELDLKDNSTLIFYGPTILNIKETIRISQKVLIAHQDQAQPKDLEINTPTTKPITIGEASFISLKLLAPNAKITLADKVTFRGQMIGKEIQVGKESVLSDKTSLIFVSSPDDIIESPGGPIFPVNEILLDLAPGATLTDVRDIISNIDGEVVGYIKAVNMYQIRVIATTEQELYSLIQVVEDFDSPKVERAFPNFVYTTSL